MPPQGLFIKKAGMVFWPYFLKKYHNEFQLQPLKTKISTPIIIYQGAADATVPIQATDLLLSTEAAKNSSISYRTEATWDHGSAYALNIPNILTDVKTLMPIQ